MFACTHLIGDYKIYIMGGGGVIISQTTGYKIGDSIVNREKVWDMRREHL